jgi:hypothetical protein
MTISGRCLPILLLPESESVDQLSVLIQIRPPEVLQEAPTTPHHLQEPLTAVMVGLVLFEVGSQMIDALREKGDLNRGTSPVALVEPILLDYTLSILRADIRHSAFICLRKSTYLQGKPSVRCNRHQHKLGTAG